MGVLSIEFGNPMYEFYVTGDNGRTSYVLEAESYERALEVCKDEGWRLMGAKMDETFDMFYGKHYQHVICKN